MTAVDDAELANLVRAYDEGRATIGGGQTGPSREALARALVAQREEARALAAFVDALACPDCCRGETCGGECAPCETCGSPGDHRMHTGVLLAAFRRQRAAPRGQEEGSG